MNRSFRSFHALTMTGVLTVLLGGHVATFAQQAPENQPASRFVTGGGLSVNLDRITAVRQVKREDGTTIQVHIILEGHPQPVTLQGNDADRFFANFVAKTGGDQTVRQAGSR